MQYVNENNLKKYMLKNLVVTKILLYYRNI